ncbi:MAG: hypothetical protein QOD94_2100 [Alphaproteobacteria bacterium]|jgi:hypothetical protein|nr:hypothetical protein [Alphaproteobacteria bacterium]
MSGEFIPDISELEFPFKGRPIIRHWMEGTVALAKSGFAMAYYLALAARDDLHDQSPDGSRPKASGVRNHVGSRSVADTVADSADCRDC